MLLEIPPVDINRTSTKWFQVKPVARKNCARKIVSSSPVPSKSFTQRRTSACKPSNLGNTVSSQSFRLVFAPLEVPGSIWKVCNIHTLYIYTYILYHLYSSMDIHNNRSKFYVMITIILNMLSVQFHGYHVHVWIPTFLLCKAEPPGLLHMSCQQPRSNPLLVKLLSRCAGRGLYAYAIIKFGIYARHVGTRTVKTEKEHQSA